MVPFLLVLLLAVAQLAVAGFALWSAGDAARAGARAAHVGGDARAAALSALPGWLEQRGTGRRPRVRSRSGSRRPRCCPGVPAIPVSAATELSRGRRWVAEPAAGWLGAERGQASIELLAAMPLVVVVAVLCLQLLATGYALTLADGAVEAGAIALASDLPAEPAVEAALPGVGPGPGRARADRRAAGGPAAPAVAAGGCRPSARGELQRLGPATRGGQLSDRGRARRRAARRGRRRSPGRPPSRSRSPARVTRRRSRATTAPWSWSRSASGRGAGPDDARRRRGSRARARPARGRLRGRGPRPPGLGAAGGRRRMARAAAAP